MVKNVLCKDDAAALYNRHDDKRDKDDIEMAIQRVESIQRSLKFHLYKNHFVLLIIGLFGAKCNMPLFAWSAYFVLNVFVRRTKTSK